ncbi:MAG: PLP-dependent aminotransferase family protein, partial [Bacteroidota bacterium]
APLAPLAREYRNVTRSRSLNRYFYYHDPKGNASLRAELAKYLQETRGIQADIDNILITRGAIMGLYLLTNTLMKAGDGIIVGESSYATANMIAQQAGAVIHPVPVDQDGIQVEAIASICQQHPIRALYVASHHHHPTTVTLSAERRVHLLQLARQYRFAIIEDDYDYDFHYNSSPILPLASADRDGMVAYVGSLSKNISPAFRIGFVYGPKNLINALGTLRRIVDRQGDQVLEQAVSVLFREGEIRRHLRKSLQHYHARRDHFCQLLEQELSGEIRFRWPDGGMAVWAEFAEFLPLNELQQHARQQGLYFPVGHQYQPYGAKLNATRLGFASLNPEELTKAVGMLKAAIASLKSR